LHPKGTQRIDGEQIQGHVNLSLIFDCPSPAFLDSESASVIERMHWLAEEIMPRIG
jgi:hypothetical protein